MSVWFSLYFFLCFFNLLLLALSLLLIQFSFCCSSCSCFHMARLDSKFNILLRAGSHSVLFEASASATSATTIIQTSSSSRPLPRQKRHLGVTSPKVWLIVTRYPLPTKPETSQWLQPLQPEAFCQSLLLLPLSTVVPLPFRRGNSTAVSPMKQSLRFPKPPIPETTETSSVRLGSWVSIMGH